MEEIVVSPASRNGLGTRIKADSDVTSPISVYKLEQDR